MIAFRSSTKEDLPRVMDIWRGAVDATHGFLSAHDRRAIEAEVSELFPQLKLDLAVDQGDTPQGFMYLHAGHLEALFVDPHEQRKGIGRSLVGRALADNPKLTVDVNEQNEMGLKFYETMGFERIGRSSCDGQSRPYALIHLRHRCED
ncbi:MAG: acetyltransferase [Pseudomonadota bacterium]